MNAHESATVRELRASELDQVSGGIAVVQGPTSPEPQLPPIITLGSGKPVVLFTTP